MRGRETTSRGCGDRGGENGIRWWLWGWEGVFYIYSHLDQLEGGGEKERFQTIPHVSRSTSWEVRMPLVQIDINKLIERGAFVKNIFIMK